MMIVYVVLEEEIKSGCYEPRKIFRSLNDAEKWVKENYNPKNWFSPVPEYVIEPFEVY